MQRAVISRIVWITSFAAAACGGDNKHPIDAFVQQDAPADAPVDAPGFVCDYTEMHDATNDYNLSTGFMTEQTGITFSGTTKGICGTMNVGHFSSSNFSVDIDDYTFTVASDADVIVALTGQLQTVSNIGVFAYNTAGMTGAGQGYFVGDHGVFSSHLTAGTYELSVEAYDNADKPAAIPYHVIIKADTPATRCPKITAAANYTEANDGVANNGNDVYVVDYSMTPYYKLTTLTTDAPEMTGLVVAPATNYRISGSSAATVQNGSYFDGDTYQFQTGPLTDQLSIRINWPSTTADLDDYLFTGGSTTPLQTTDTIALTEPEFRTVAVAPNATYWLWVGAFSSSTNLPATYDISICGETFTP